jgi:hypothetical protein
LTKIMISLGLALAMKTYWDLKPLCCLSRS